MIRPDHFAASATTRAGISNAASGNEAEGLGLGGLDDFPDVEAHPVEHLAPVVLEMSDPNATDGSIRHALNGRGVSV